MLKKYFLLLCVFSLFSSGSFAFEMGSISRIENEKAYLTPGLYTMEFKNLIWAASKPRDRPIKIQLILLIWAGFL